MNTTISVIIPVFNMGSSIEKSVQSLLNQDYPDFEIILVDDGSKDSSLAVCRNLEKNNANIRVFHTENRGAGPARNLGIMNAKGDFIYFPDADDYLEPNGLTTMMNAVEGDCDLVVFGFRTADRHGKVVREKTYPNSVKSGDEIRKHYADYVDMSKKWGIQGAPWNKFFKRSIIVEKGVEFPPLRRHQDEGFISRYMCYANKVHFIPDVLYTYYVNDLGKEWDKYPPDYIENVAQLYEIRKQTILTWNPDDDQTCAEVDKSYINKFIKALELSFSPKRKLSFKERKKWIETQVREYNFNSINKDVGLSKYQRLICILLEHNSILTAELFMRIKIFAEKTGILSKLKLHHR